MNEQNVSCMNDARERLSEDAIPFPLQWDL